MQSTKSDTLRLKEAAQWLNIAPRTLQSWIKKKKISHYDKIGGEYRFSISKHLQPFLDAYEVKSAINITPGGVK